MPNDEWLPMETAPTDGTRILVWCSFWNIVRIGAFKDNRYWWGEVPSQPSALSFPGWSRTQYRGWMHLPTPRKEWTDAAPV